MDYIGFGTSLEEYSNFTIQQKRELAKTHHSKNRDWFLSKIKELESEWLLVGGNSGQIYAHGTSPEFFSEEEKKELERENSEVIFKWIKPPMIDSPIIGYKG